MLIKNTNKKVNGQATKKYNVFIAWLINKSLDPIYYKEFLQIDKKKDGWNRKTYKSLELASHICTYIINIRRDFQYH